MLYAWIKDTEKKSIIEARIILNKWIIFKSGSGMDAFHVSQSEKKKKKKSDSLPVLKKVYYCYYHFLPACRVDNNNNDI